MKLIASGRTADVFALDGQRVLRRYRSGGAAEDEARLMRYVAERGYPVPEVHDATASDLVLERLHGPTMLDDVAGRPWRVRAHGRTLGGLLDRLHAVAAPDWLPVRPGSRERRLLHLDLHPGNVVLSTRGPVVIDWSNALAGDPAVDVALAAILMSTGDTGLRGWRLRVLPLVRRAMVGGLLRGSRAAGGGGALPAEAVAEAAEYRLADGHVTQEEVARIRRYLTRLSP
jgi:Ser/Thr protein kinase RdoA (MazF antagonist)